MLLKKFFRNWVFMIVVQAAACWFFGFTIDETVMAVYFSTVGCIFGYFVAKEYVDELETSEDPQKSST